MTRAVTRGVEVRASCLFAPDIQVRLGHRAASRCALHAACGHVRRALHLARCMLVARCTLHEALHVACWLLVAGCTLHVACRSAPSVSADAVQGFVYSIRVRLVPEGEPGFVSEAERG
jgi:hypothetical protein